MGTSPLLPHHTPPCGTRSPGPRGPPRMPEQTRRVTGWWTHARPVPFWCLWWLSARGASHTAECWPLCSRPIQGLADRSRRISSRLATLPSAPGSCPRCSPLDHQAVSGPHCRGPPIWCAQDLPAPAPRCDRQLSEATFLRRGRGSWADTRSVFTSVNTAPGPPRPH